MSFRYTILLVFLFSFGQGVLSFGGLSEEERGFEVLFRHPPGKKVKGAEKGVGAEGEVGEAEQQLRDLMQSFHQGDLVDKSFVEEVGSLFAEQRGNAAISEKMQRYLDLGAKAGAVLASAAFGEFSMTLISEVFDFSDSDSFVFPRQAVMASVLGTIPAHYRALSTMLRRLSRQSGQHRGATEHGMLANGLRRLALPIGGIGLAGGVVRARIIADHEDMTPGLVAASIAEGIPWATVLLWRFYEIANQGLTTVALKANAFFARRTEGSQVIEMNKKELRYRWVAGLKRTMVECEASAALWDTIMAIQNTVEEETKKCQESLDLLAKETSGREDDAGKSVERQVLDLQNQKQGWEHMGDLLTLQTLWNFGETSGSTSELQEETGWGHICGNHPLWYEGTRMAGRLMGGFVLGSYCALSMRTEMMYLHDPFAYLFVMLFTAVYMQEVGDGLARVVSRLVGYNPTVDGSDIRESYANRGLAGHGETWGILQELKALYKGENDDVAVQQRLASLYRHVDQWTGKLRGDLVGTLLTRMKQDSTEWFEKQKKA